MSWSLAMLLHQGRTRAFTQLHLFNLGCVVHSKFCHDVFHEHGDIFQQTSRTSCQSSIPKVLHHSDVYLTTWFFYTPPQDSCLNSQMMNYILGVAKPGVLFRHLCQPPCSTPDLVLPALERSGTLQQTSSATHLDFFNRTGEAVSKNERHSWMSSTGVWVCAHTPWIHIPSEKKVGDSLM